MKKESDSRNPIHRQFMSNPAAYISEDGHSRTKWDHKRLKIYAEKKKNTATKTDFTDKADQQPSELSIALKCLEQSLADKNEFTRFIDEKNEENARKLINGAHMKRYIDKNQKEILYNYLGGFFNKSSGA